MPNATVRIISLWTKHGDRPAFEYDVTVPAGATAEATLENAFILTNHDDRPHGRQCCSTTCGDLMVLDGQHYFVDRFGYRRLTPDQAAQVRQLTSRDTSSGWHWLVQQHLVTA